jgi:hypothetical protein
LDPRVPVPPGAGALASLAGSPQPRRHRP